MLSVHLRRRFAQVSSCVMLCRLCTVFAFVAMTGAKPVVAGIHVKAGADANGAEQVKMGMRVACSIEKYKDPHVCRHDFEFCHGGFKVAFSL